MAQNHLLEADDVGPPSLPISRKSGRSPPMLTYELRTYDPRALPPSGFNIFRDEILPYYEGKAYPLTTARDACRHQFVMKENQSTDSRIMVTCMRCRVRFSSEVQGEGICSGNTNQFHHLLLKDARGSIFSGEINHLTTESYHFECSLCDTTVKIEYSPPVLSSEHVELLTNTQLIQSRTEQARKFDPNPLEGIATASPSVILDVLRKYISKALDGSALNPFIRASNKKFVVCFGIGGNPCQSLFNHLGFEKSPDSNVWNTPASDSDDPIPYHGSRNRFLDDVCTELMALLLARPDREREAASVPAFSLVPPEMSIMNSLDASKYDTEGDPNVSNSISYYFKHIGVPPNTTTETIIKFYELQAEVDPERSSYYLRCLKRIGQTRGSPLISSFVEAEYAKGRLPDTDIYEAYAYFGLPEPFDNHEDDTVIGLFRARLADDPIREEAMRRHLRTIGIARRSESILGVAEDRIINYQQALSYLDVLETTPDDFIVSSYTSKIEESPKTKATAKKALDIIAKERNSGSIRSFLKTGSVEELDMDIGEAYTLFEITDRTLEDEVIAAVFESSVVDAPGRVEEYRKALGAIAKSRNSDLLQQFLNGGIQAEPMPVRADMPVGLDNIGNTCYLNSLLQFFFTIQPFRNMILDIEQFLEDVDKLDIQKQVGSRKVTVKEIQRSQKFVLELKKLFQEMITSPSSAILPTQELARLTLISSSNEADIRRRSTISGARPGLGDIDGAPISGPLGPPIQTTESVQEEKEVEENNGEQEDTDPFPQSFPSHLLDDYSSYPLKPSKRRRKVLTKMPCDDALVEIDVIMIDAEDAKDKENKPPSNAKSSVPESTDEAPQGPPNRPPPVPPRPIVNKQPTIKEELELGAQQDVIEVINNVLFQSSCAVRAEYVDANGEQFDKVKQLFYGKSKSYIVAEGKSRTKEELFCDIKINVASGPQDIYTALSGALDVQDVTVDGSAAKQYTTISTVPPVLQIQIQRVQYDPVKKGSFKSNHHLELMETVYLDRYLDYDNDRPDLVERRAESWSWKAELQKLTARMDELKKHEDSDAHAATATEDAAFTFKHLQGINDDEESMTFEPDTLGDLETLITQANQELNELSTTIKDTQSKINSQFTDCRKLPYRLHSVFIHRGSVSFGHYWIYIYDFKRDIWRKYNDGYVTEIADTREIFEHSDDTTPATPY